MCLLFGFQSEERRTCAFLYRVKCSFSKQVMAHMDISLSLFLSFSVSLRQTDTENTEGDRY